MALYRYDNGRLPRCAWPGGHSLIYRAASGRALCPDCANGSPARKSAASEDHADPEWRLVGCDIYDRGSAIPCAHCGEEITSTYGGN